MDFYVKIAFLKSFPHFCTIKLLLTTYKVFRVSNLLLIFLSLLFLDYALFGHTIHAQTVLLATCICLTAAAGYIINDYYDVKIDVINKPDKVIIDRDISRKAAIIIHLATTCIAIGLAFFLNIKVVILIIFSSLLLWWYSNTLKRLPLWGNLAVALLSALSIVSLHLLYPEKNDEILFYSLMVFTCTLARELSKDLEDIEGDQSHGCRTLPIVIGIRKVKWVIVLLLILLILLSAFFTYFYLPTLFFFYVLIIIPYILFVIKELIPADKKQDFHNLSFHLKWIISLGIISIIFL